MDNIESLKYTELQKLAKKHGIKANQKADRLIASLRRVIDNASIQPSLPLGDRDEDSTQLANVGSSATSTKTKSVTPKIKAKAESLTPKGRAKSVTPKGRAKSVTPKGRAKSTPKGRAKSVTPKRRAKSTTPKGRSKSVTPKGQAKSVAPKGRAKSVTPKDRANSAKSITPKGQGKLITPKGQAKSITPKGRAKSVTPKGRGKSITPKGRGKSVTPKGRAKSVTPKGQGNVVAGRPESQNKKNTRRSADDDDNEIVLNTKKHRRKNTYTKEVSSPDVKDLLDSMKETMSEEERKEGLMAALDKNVETNEMEGKKRQSGSHIPRFTGVTARGKETNKTPGKDWSKIHQRQWDKMDSLDEYLAKKRKRTDGITQSVKRLKQMTQELDSSVQKHKEQTYRGQNTPSNEPKPAPFQSPATTQFKPTVMSTSNMNFNFGGIPTNEKKVFTGNKGNSSMKNARTSVGKQSATKEKALFTIGQSRKPKSPLTKPSKENHRKSFTTPAKLNSTINKSQVSASGTKFDIASSLAKPLTWKPHKGQLKPFSFGNLYSQKPDVKAVKVKTRDDRRREATKHRATKKSDFQMSRRGLAV